ncbi:MAG: TonB-dependent receptor [Elusimicrobia bacterium]|nr:TonB-dependent receptor [Elusimicrobiota bacterium]
MDVDYDRTQRLDWNLTVREVSAVVRELKAQAYWDGVRHLMDDRLRQSAAGKARYYSMQTDATTQVVGGRLQAGLAAGPGTLRGGVDYYNRTWEAKNRLAGSSYVETGMVPDVSVDNGGLFVDYELPLSERHRAKAGVRVDVTWAQAHAANGLVVAGTTRRFGEASASPQSIGNLFRGRFKGPKGVWAQ